MPAVSQAQRGYLASKFGVAWMRRHHFDNPGPLPSYKSKGMKSAKSKSKGLKQR